MHASKSIHDLKGKTFKHYKGGIYTVIDVALHTEDCSSLVIYKAHSDGTLWARPLDMFLETITHQGKIIPRFETIRSIHHND